MKNLISPLFIGEVFGLDQGDLDRVERIALPPPEGDGHDLYLFRCENLLPEGHALAINERCGSIGVYSDGAIVKKTVVETEEILVLTAFALSFPFPVGERQIHSLYQMLRMKEHDVKATYLAGDEHSIPPVDDLVAACNEKISALGLALSPAEVPDQSASVSERGSEKTRVFCLTALSPGV